MLSNRLGAGLLRPFWQGRASIFMLHRLSQRVTSGTTLTIESITQSIAALRNAGARFVALSHLFECAAKGVEPEPGSVAFTIDDGFADQGVIAREAFERNECPVTVFLIAGFIDGRLWPWDDQIAYAIRHGGASHAALPPDGRPADLTTPDGRRAAIGRLQNYCKSVPWDQAASALDELYSGLGCRPPAEPPGEYRPLGWDDIRALESRFVEFAPHSLSHRITSRLNDEEAREEIEGSWQRLRKELRRPTQVYAWPTGRDVDFSERDMKIAQSIGLHGAVSTNDDYGNFRAQPGNSQHLYRVRRFAMSAYAVENLQVGTGFERFRQTLRRGA